MLASLFLAACAGTGTHSRYPEKNRRLPTLSTETAITLQEIAIHAMALVGTPYRYGGNTPDGGFDCSGLVNYVVNQAMRVQLPRSTMEMSAVGSELERAQLTAGDLVFFNTTGQPFSHVGIYVGDNQFVHAPSSGGTVRLDDMSKAYWTKRYAGARRLVSS